jgi:NADPH-dependent 2,4-dienoyl-CoA reductase/sulfur reductase-like enzyme
MSSASLQFDVVVVGAGPAGLSAACLAAESGQKVALLDNSPWLGGQIWRGEQAQPHDHAAASWIERLQGSGATVFSEATVFGAPEAGCLLAETPSEALQLSYRRLVIATGARELFLPFPGWTLPGVIGPGGLHAMSKAGWPVARKRVVVAGSGPLLLAVAAALRQHGAEVRLVAEQTAFSKVTRFGLGLLRYPGKLIQAAKVKARLLGIPYQCGCWPVAAPGGAHVESVTLTDGTRSWTEPCDYLACAFGFVPNVELAVHLGCELKGGFVRVDELQQTTIPNVYCAGEPTGIGGADCALVEGQIAGFAASGQQDRARSLFASRASWHRFREALAVAFALRSELRSLATPETMVCRCEDVSFGQIDPQQGLRAAKLHTRCGMGPCQGRICGGALRFLFNWGYDSVRVPILPVRTASLVPSGSGGQPATPGKQENANHGKESV